LISYLSAGKSVMSEYELEQVLVAVEKRLSAVERNGVGIIVSHVGDRPCSVCMSYQQAVRDVLKSVRANIESDPDTK
jgi:hypothetical protein